MATDNGLYKLSFRSQNPARYAVVNISGSALIPFFCDFIVVDYRIIVNRIFMRNGIGIKQHGKCSTNNEHHFFKRSYRLSGNCCCVGVFFLQVCFFSCFAKSNKP
jgi:hypothetical protein